MPRGGRRSGLVHHQRLGHRLRFEARAPAQLTSKVAERTVEFAQRLVFVFERDLVGLAVPAHKVQCALEDGAEGLVHLRRARSREGADPSP